MDKNIYVNEPYFHPSLPGAISFRDDTHHTTGNGALGMIDLNEALVKNKQTTFFLRVNCQAVKDAGIHKGDVVIVDRSLPATDGKVVIAALGGELLIRKLLIIEKRMHLVGDRLAPLVLDERDACIWGVVTFVIHGF